MSLLWLPEISHRPATAASAVAAGSRSGRAGRGEEGFDRSVVGESDRKLAPVAGDHGRIRHLAPLRRPLGRRFDDLEAARQEVVDHALARWRPQAVLGFEAISRGQGQDLQMGWPQMTFKVRPGLNTYEVALKSLVQPGWVEIKVDPKKILQKLTGLTITAYCDQCRPMEGMLIVDNVAFER